ncbi:MAG: YidC/Oxa1 family insertase periplasmic-domain containing protein [Candidatus Omnitrophota bacterium]
MDRNTILAIALTMLIFSLYQSVFVVPKKMEALKKSQIVQNKDLVRKPSEFIPATTLEQSKTTSPDIKEKITTLKTTNVEIELSNVGGSLHNFILQGEEKTLPIDNSLTLKGFEKSPFLLISKNENSATYSYSNSDWKITKRFEIKEDNSVSLKVLISNLNKTSRLETFEFKGLAIDSSNIDIKNNKSTMLFELSVLENNKITRKGNAYKFNVKDNKLNNAKVEWVGFRDHYHAIVVKPEFETKAYENKMVSENKLDVNIQAKEREIPSGETSEYTFTVVAGNQDITWLKSYKKSFDRIVAFSGWWIIDICSKGVYYTIPVLHSICRSWGLSIILVSLLIYGITYPLTIKSMASMKKMQMVQPKVAALQQKYKDNPQKLNSEMIDLYKREGVNPLGGCLPFLLQMPIFMALYQALWRAYYFQGKGFLWIKDLAQPDRLIILPKSLPFLGNEINILPVVMGAVMFLQQNLSAKNMVVTDETQAMQQKMMRYFFPVFIAFIFYHFASGLSLYFTVFYSLSTWTQWKMGTGKGVAVTGSVSAAK